VPCNGQAPDESSRFLALVGSIIGTRGLHEPVRWVFRHHWVLKALRGAGINVAAIHQHMVEEQPRMMFLHFWGAGTSETLAQGLKTALGVQKA
jgi:hypothetical protein